MSPNWSSGRMIALFGRDIAKGFSRCRFKEQVLPLNPEAARGSLECTAIYAVATAQLLISAYVKILSIKFLIENEPD